MAFRSPLFPLALSAPPPAGVRSMLAPWIGGAGQPSLTPAGVRSMVAFWMGGAVAPVARGGGGGGPSYRHPSPDTAAARRRRDERDLLDLLTLLSPHL